MRHGEADFTYRQFEDRVRRLASALVRRGVGVGNTVAVMLANTPEMYEAHFGVPMTGGVLNSLNTRLDAAMVAFIIDHSETKVFLVDLSEVQAIWRILSFLMLGLVLLAVSIVYQRRMK